MKKIYNQIRMRNEDEYKKVLDCLMFKDGSMAFSKFKEVPESLLLTFVPVYKWEIVPYLFRNNRNLKEIRKEIEDLEKEYPYKLNIKTDDISLEKLRRSYQDDEDIFYEDLGFNSLVDYSKNIVFNKLKYNAHAWDDWARQNWGTPQEGENFMTQDELFGIFFMTDETSPVKLLKDIAKSKKVSIYVTTIDSEFQDGAEEIIINSKGEIEKNNKYEADSFETFSLISKFYDPNQNLIRYKNGKIVYKDESAKKHKIEESNLFEEFIKNGSK